MIITTEDFILLSRICQDFILVSVIVLLGDSMKPLKEKVSLTLDGPIVEKIKELAEYEDRSLSSYINLVLREHLEKKKEAK